MRLEITRRADLATRAMLILSTTADRTKAAALAEHLDSTAGFVAQAMTPLVAKGWVQSDPGPTGGYTLVADLADVSVLQVIEAVEGTTDTARCVLEDRACARGGHCALHVPWQRARTQLLGELSDTPLSAITRKARR
jgi:Rrf2 family iron-sulfur cluster assembly transcriptional regulator